MEASTTTMMETTTAPEPSTDQDQKCFYFPDECEASTTEASTTEALTTTIIGSTTAPQSEF